MPGETDLDRLLASMTPALRGGCFLFVTLAPGTPVPAAVDVVASVHEDEGLTVVVPAEHARDHGLDGEFPCARITLRVHSALDAVGFLAAVTEALARSGISVNAIAGFHHDHLFVPWSRRHDAVAVLDALSSRHLPTDTVQDPPGRAGSR